MFAAAATSLRHAGLPATQASDDTTDFTPSELMLIACTRFCDDEGAGGSERLHPVQFREAFYCLIDLVDGSTRARVATMLARRAEAPRAIVLYLAQEPIAVARPLLRSSPVLGQLDLVRIIHGCSEEHAAIIAQRSDLGQAVRRALDATHAVAAEVPVLTPEAAREPIELPVFQPPAPVATAEEKLLKAAARGGRLALPAAPVIARTTPVLRRGAFAVHLDHAARSGSRPKVAAALMARFQLTLETAHQVLEDETGQTMAVLLKSDDVDVALAHRVIMLLFDAVGLNLTNAEDMIDFYTRQLEVKPCLEAVSQWPKSSAPSAGATSDPALDPAGRRRVETSDSREAPLVHDNAVERRQVA